MAVIGIFDSGSGGLSVLREIRKVLPSERYIYYSDNAHCPYGEKSAEYIQERARVITRLLLDRGADVIVVACNTATGADTIVLGCTHYPFLLPVIERLAGPGVRVIDPAPAVARQLVHILTERGLLNSHSGLGPESPALELLASGDPTTLQRLASNL